MKNVFAIKPAVIYLIDKVPFQQVLNWENLLISKVVSVTQSEVLLQRTRDTRVPQAPSKGPGAGTAPATTRTTRNQSSVLVLPENKATP